MATPWVSLQPSASISKALVLNSWKEIATYLGRAVRTVQRYERDFDLPVRRVGGKAGNAVVALPEDLDAWLRRSFANGSSDATIKSSMTGGTSDEAATEYQLLRLHCEALRQKNNEALVRLVANLNTMAREVRAVRYLALQVRTVRETRGVRTAEAQANMAKPAVDSGQADAANF